MFVSSTREKSHCLLIFRKTISKTKSLCWAKATHFFLKSRCSSERRRETRPKVGEQTSSAARPWIFNSIVHRPLFKLARFALWCKFDASQRRPDVLQLCYSPPSCFQFSLLPFANNPGYELARELIIRREMSKVASNVLINKILFDDRSITEFKPSF